MFMVTAIDLSLFNYTSKNYDFWEYVKFGAISLKFDFLLITAWLKFESKNPFAHMWHVWL